MGGDPGLTSQEFLPPVAGSPPPPADPPPPRLVLAGWGWRALASAVDVLVLLPVVLVAVVVTGVETGTDDLTAFGTSSDSLIIGAVVTVAFAVYTTVSLTLWRGRTVGKHAVGIRVVREDGAPPDWRTAVVRQVPLQAVVGSFVPFFGVADYLWPLWDRENRALHDLLARTRVVRA